VLGEFPETAYLGEKMPVVEVGDSAAKGVKVRLAPHECASKPTRERLVRLVGIVVGERVEVGTKWGVGWPVTIGVPCNASVVELFDPFGGTGESCVVWYKETRGVAVVLFVAVRGCLESTLVMVDLLLELSDANVSPILRGELVELSFVDSGNEPASDVLEHDSIKGFWVVEDGEDGVGG